MSTKILQRLMIRTKTEKEIEILREGGAHLARILDTVSKKIASGVSSSDLDKEARRLIEEVGAEPSFLGYKPDGVSVPYPAALCVSMNEEIVHGIPGQSKVIRDGDIVTIDCGLKYKGMYTDMAITLVMGETTDEIRKLIKTTEESLMMGIEKAVIGNKIGDIGAAIGSHIKKAGFHVVEGLAGHGVGFAVHEDPYVPNEGKEGKGDILKEGMVIAIEPMASIGSRKIVGLEDQFTFVTSDDSMSAHFEHTVAITKDGPVIITNLD